MSRHEGVTALISGGSRGIGLAAAQRIVAEGGRVSIVARDAQRSEQALQQIDPDGSGRAMHVAADCTRVEDIERAHSETVERLGPVTALVNNVGTSLRGPFLEVTDEDWQRDLDLKFFAAIRFSRLVIPGMIERGEGGRIINILSTGGKNPGPASGPTAMTRAAGLALTKSLSKEFAQYRILVNAICIGLIKAGQHEDRWTRKNDESLDEYYARLAESRGVPLGRVGEGWEAGALVSFLISDESAFISGTAINLDGGASPSL